MRIVSLACFGLILAGCQVTGTSPSPASERVLGTLGLFGERWQVTRCDGSESIRVQLPDNLLDEAARCVTDNETGCFVDLNISRSAAGTDRIGQIHRLQHEGWGCEDTEFPRLYLRASGNEPFWNIRISDQGLVLQKPGLDTLALPYIREQLGHDLQLISSQANNNSLKLWIEHQPCTDSMTGSWFAQSARLEWQGEILTGCAHYGAQYNSTP